MQYPAEATYRLSMDAQANLRELRQMRGGDRADNMRYGFTCLKVCRRLWLEMCEIVARRDAYSEVVREFVPYEGWEPGSPLVDPAGQDPDWDKEIPVDVDVGEVWDVYGFDQPKVAGGGVVATVMKKVPGPSGIQVIDRKRSNREYGIHMSHGFNSMLLEFRRDFGLVHQDLVLDKAVNLAWGIQDAQSRYCTVTAERDGDEIAEIQ